MEEILKMEKLFILFLLIAGVIILGLAVAALYLIDAISKSSKPEGFYDGISKNRILAVKPELWEKIKDICISHANSQQSK
jgi:hypothetical protein